MIWTFIEIIVCASLTILFIFLSICQNNFTDYEVLKYTKVYNNNNYYKYYNNLSKNNFKQICFLKNYTGDVQNFKTWFDNLILFTDKNIKKNYCNLTSWTNIFNDKNWNALLSWNNYDILLLKHKYVIDSWDAINIIRNNYKLLTN